METNTSTSVFIIKDLPAWKECWKWHYSEVDRYFRTLSKEDAREALLSEHQPILNERLKKLLELNVK